MAVLEQSWIKVQEKTFGKWCVCPPKLWENHSSQRLPANVLVTAG